MPAVNDGNLFLIICSNSIFHFSFFLLLQGGTGGGSVEQKALKIIALSMKTQVRQKLTNSTQYMSSEVKQEMQLSFYTY